jgi:ketosteroid isomerase-like protein
MHHATRLFVTAAVAICGWAADLKNEERVIRALIADQDAGARAPYSDDVIFASGRFSRAIIGSKALSEEEARLQQEPTSRRDNRTVKHDVVRIQIADSGDLAYEFTNFQLGYDNSSNEHVQFGGHLLRIWRKENGSWKVAALVARPSGPPSSTPK